MKFMYSCLFTICQLFLLLKKSWNHFPPVKVTNLLCIQSLVKAYLHTSSETTTHSFHVKYTISFLVRSPVETSTIRLFGSALPLLSFAYELQIENHWPISSVALFRNERSVKNGAINFKIRARCRHFSNSYVFTKAGWV